MLSSLDDILSTNVDYTAANSLTRVDHQVVVLSHLEGIHTGLGVEYTLIDGVADRVVDEFAIAKLAGSQDTFLTIKEFHPLLWWRGPCC